MQGFLPPAMPSGDIDALLAAIVREQNLTCGSEGERKRALGVLLKLFFARVDKALVNGSEIKQRAAAALEKAS